MFSNELRKRGGPAGSAPLSTVFCNFKQMESILPVFNHSLSQEFRANWSMSAAPGPAHLQEITFPGTAIVFPFTLFPIYPKVFKQRAVGTCHGFAFSEYLI
jgi:hypothetical protein